ncbi:hypothetical protein AAHK20_08290, partial [Trinickia sp. YCB016]
LTSLPSCVAASAAEKRDYEEPFSLRQLIFCIRLNLADVTAAGFCSGARFKSSEEANSRPTIAP